MTDPNPRRAAGITSRFQPRVGRRTDLTEFSDHQQALVDLEDIAVSLTVNGLHGLADRTRDIARRLA